MKSVNSLVSKIESNQTNRLQKFFDKPNKINKIVKNTLIESFEKKEIGLTTDYIALIIKKQLEKLLKRQEDCNNLEITWFDKALKEWIVLIAQLRGDITQEKEGDKILLAQQFVEKNKDYEAIITHLLKE